MQTRILLGVAAAGVLMGSSVTWAADVQYLWSGASGTAWSVSASWSPGIADDTDLTDTNNVVMRTSNFSSQRIISLDSNRTVAKVWYNTDGAGAAGATAAGGLTIDTSNGSILTLATNGGTPQLAAGRITAATSSLTINAVLAGTQGFTVSQQSSPYLGAGVVLTAANTVSGTVSGYNLLTLKNTQALQNATIQMSSGGTLNLRSDANATFQSVGLTQADFAAAANINVNEASVGGGGGTPHVLQLAGNYTTGTGTKAKTLAIGGGNGYGLELTGTITNAHASGVLTFQPNSANVKLSGSTVAVGTGGLTLSGALASGVNEISGVMSGAGGVTKSDVSTWKLSGNNVYAGATTISGGTLLNTGATSGLGAFGFGVLAADATLGGTNTIGLAADKSVTIAGASGTARAIVSPGDSSLADTIGTLNIVSSGTGKTVLGNYSVLNIELNDDMIDVLSVKALDLSSLLDSVQITATGTQNGSRYVFARYTGSLGSGTFSSESYSGLSGASIDYSVAGEIAVMIPEPGTGAMLLLAAGLGLVGARRRRAMGA